MIKPVIAVAETAFPDRASLEKDFGHRAELRWIDVSSPGTIQESTSRAGAVVVTLQRLSADVITAFAPSVRVIGRAGVGLDTIDLAAAADAAARVREAVSFAESSPLPDPATVADGVTGQPLKMRGAE
jgi:D-3-phosphoglycerate dehydrogenase